MSRLFFFVLLCPFLMYGQNQWSSQFDAVRSYSSPRVTDLNQDGVLDVVLGSGVDGFPSPFGAIAVDGSNGQTLWTMESTNEIFSSPVLHDFNNDNVDDVIVGGRDAELRLIDGSSGQLIWKFWNDNTAHPNDSGWYNFYSPQLLEDVNNDGIKDILCANGGDHSLDDMVTERPPGHLVIIDGSNGQVLNKAVVPDSNETYMSPLITDLESDGNFEVIFGTGGETIAGNLWICSLNDLLNNDISSATALLDNPLYGMIAPPAIADINEDGLLDVISQCFDGSITAISGNGLTHLWNFQLPNTESSASPILGNFTPSDNGIDVFATLYVGGQSSYYDFYQVVLDGQTGNTLFMDSIGDFHFSSPIAFDSNNDGNDEVLISVSRISNGFMHELILLDFVSDASETIMSQSGGDVWSSPLATDLTGDGYIDIVSVTQNNNPFVADGISIQSQTTDFLIPTKGLSWSTYMGNAYNGHFTPFFKECTTNSSLYLYPSTACPNQQTGAVNLLTTNSNSIFSYSWSNGAVTEDIFEVPTGNYSVIVSDLAGCQSVANTSVDEYSTTTSVSDVSEFGGNDGWAYFNISGCSCNSSNCQYTWYINDSLIVQGDGSSSSQTYKYLYNLSAGTYIATITMPNGCTVSEEITVHQPDLLGCTDSIATNFNPLATLNDGTCQYPTVNSPCDYTPTGLFVDNIIHNRVTFNWDAPSAAPSYYMIRYRPVGSNQWTVMRAGPETANAFTGTSRTRYFHEAGTTYEWSMRARMVDESLATICQSPWSANAEYTTLPACANLENLSVSTEANWVTFFADAPDASWGVWQSKGKMREAGTNAFRYVNGGSDGSINGLKGNFTPSTDYEWHTKAWCTGNVDADGNPDPMYHSGWGDFSTFSTEAPCDKMPINLTTSTNGANTAVTMTWDTPESGAPDHYFLEMTNLTTGNVYQWNNIPGTDNSKTKFGQNPGDEISWRIRGACGTNGTSWATIFSQPATFTLGGARMAQDIISGLDVYPNPSRGIFNIRFETEETHDVELVLSNYLGETIFSHSIKEINGTFNKEFDLGNEAKGVYFLSIKSTYKLNNHFIVIQ